MVLSRLNKKVVNIWILCQNNLLESPFFSNDKQKSPLSNQYHQHYNKEYKISILDTSTAIELVIVPTAKKQ